MDITGRLIAIVLIAPFAIERVTAAIGFILGEPKPEKERTRKVVLFCIAAVIGAAVVWLTGIRILYTLKIGSQLMHGLDFALTWLVLVAGADRIREFIGGSGGGGGEKKAAEVPPIQIIVADRDGEITVKQLPHAS